MRANHRPPVLHVVIGSRVTRLSGTVNVLDLVQAAGQRVDWDRFARAWFIRTDNVADVIALAEYRGVIVRLRNIEDTPRAEAPEAKKAPRVPRPDDTVTLPLWTDGGDAA